MLLHATVSKDGRKLRTRRYPSRRIAVAKRGDRHAPQDEGGMRASAYPGKVGIGFPNRICATQEAFTVASARSLVYHRRNGPPAAWNHQGGLRATATHTAKSVDQHGGLRRGAAHGRDR